MTYKINLFNQKLKPVSILFNHLRQKIGHLNLIMLLYTLNLLVLFDIFKHFINSVFTGIIDHAKIDF